MKHSQDEDNDIPTSAESISSKQKKFNAVKIRITDLNETFDVKVFGSKESLTYFPSYIELSNPTSIGTYNKYKADISQGLKNKPKYLCNLIDENKLPIILKYYTNKEYMSLNMDHIDNKKVLISFMMSPIKDSIFFEGMADIIGHKYTCDFSISLTVPLTYEIGHSLFLCKYTSKVMFII